MSELTPQEEAFRRLAIETADMPISAGVRLSHKIESVKAGRACIVNLAAIPEDQRRQVIAELNEHVKKRAVELAPEAAKTAG